MPASRNVSRPLASSTTTLPGWGSAWKKPSTMTICTAPRTRFRASSCRSSPAASMSRVSVDLTPSMNSSVSTRPEESSGVHRRNVDSVDLREHALEPARVVGLDRVVELAQQGAPELAHDSGEVGVGGPIDPALQHRGAARQDLDVGPQLVVDVRALHLHRDATTVVRRRLVHLCERRGRERRRAERRRTASPAARPATA